jgi:hypothetical protein
MKNITDEINKDHMKEAVEDYKNDFQSALWDYGEIISNSIEYIEQVEAKLENALEALERIGKGEFAGQMLMSLPPQDAGAHFARMTLATIKPHMTLEMTDE